MKIIFSLWRVFFCLLFPKTKLNFDHHLGVLKSVSTNSLPVIHMHALKGLAP